jgi:Zn-finger nucleic acid-binding protein
MALAKETVEQSEGDVLGPIAAGLRGFFYFKRQRLPERSPIKACECGSAFLQTAGHPSGLCPICRGVRDDAGRRAAYLARLETDPAGVRASNAAHRRRWRANNPGYKRYEETDDAKRERKLVRKYGITLAEYDGMHTAQGGVCAICNEPERIDRRLAVDHCHVTGRVRGLLCAMCNTAIGKLRDSTELLERALHYQRE